VGEFNYRDILGKNEKIFLTGHTGFKGTWLTLLLEEMGHEVVGFSLEAAPNSLFDRLGRQGFVNETIGDIRDINKLNAAMKTSKPSIVIHLAAQALVLGSYKDPRGTFEINAQGTANVLDASFSVGTVNVIGAITTDKVYKNQESQHAYVETDPLEGGSDPYSASKVASEAAISVWKKITDVSGGPRIVTLRSGNVIGGGDFSENRLIPDLVRGYLSGINVEVRNPQSTRPWMHVLDSLVGYLLAIDLSAKTSVHNTFNFAPLEESISVQHVINIALEEWPEMFKVKPHKNPKQYPEADLLNLNPSKAVEYLSWKPKWDQDSSIRSSINWWKKHYTQEINPDRLCKDEILRVLKNA